MILNYQVREKKTKIHMDEALLSGALLSNMCLTLGRRFVIVSDPHVSDLYGERLKNTLIKKNLECLLITFSGKEADKNRKTKEEIEDQMLEARYGRDTCLIALGGGVVTDLAAFVAATYCRGIPYLLIPTTLLGMVDASLGSKTGLNVKEGKNLVGSFYPPQAIFMDLLTLTTLSDQEMRHGGAEIIKYGLIAKGTLYELIRNNTEKWEQRDPSLLRALIYESCLIKKRIVEADLEERGLRRGLNFGHTVSHALEAVEEYQIPHGEALAIGMIVESLISLKLGTLEKKEFQQIYHLLKRMHFPLRVSSRVTIKQMIEHMGQDKKAVRATPRFVILDGIGKVLSFGGAHCTLIDEGILREVLAWMIKEFYKETKQKSPSLRITGKHSTQLHISPSALKGTLVIPPSKSHTLRALLFALMGKGQTVIHTPLPSPDTTAMIGAIEQLGARVTSFPDRLEVEGVHGELRPAEDVIWAGNSGQVLRFIGALAALLPTYTVITGDHSIRHNRPIKPLLDGLRGLGATAESTRGDGYAPILIKGRLKGGTTHLGGEDSQPVSGLIIASVFALGQTKIHVTCPGETPWIDLTLDWLDFLNLPYHKARDYTSYTLWGQGHFKGFDYTVPGDLTSLSYPLVAAILTGSEITLNNVDIDDIQGDKKIIDILIEMGARIEIDRAKKVLFVRKGGPLQGKKIDINGCIDGITLLAVVGCFATGTSQIHNGKVARTKECDRIHAITTELKKMGADIQEKEDGVVIKHSPLKGAIVNTQNDHRMAMALTVAALAATGDSVIQGADCVQKSYPHFAHHLQKIGADLT